MTATDAAILEPQIRVLHLISTIGFFGAENVVLNLCRGLRDLGHDPTVGVFVAERNPRVVLADLAEAAGLKVARFKSNGRADVSTFGLVRNYLDREAAHLIHSHNYKANIYARWAARRKVAKISTLHNWTATTKRMRFYIAIDRLVLRGFDKVVAVSGPVRSSLVDAGINPERIRVIENGVPSMSSGREEARAAMRRQLAVPGDALVFGTVGRLSREKGHSVLIEAAGQLAQRLPAVVLLVVGDGPERRSLEQACLAFPGLRVIFTGVRSDVTDLLAAMDVFALPSMTEGHPVALLEAMAAGKPVVASAVGGVPDILEGGGIGIMVTPGDPRALAAALEGLGSDRGKAMAMGERAKLAVASQYSVERMARRYVDVYRETIRKRESPHSIARR